MPRNESMDPWSRPGTAEYDDLRAGSAPESVRFIQGRPRQACPRAPQSGAGQPDELRKMLSATPRQRRYRSLLLFSVMT